MNALLGRTNLVCTICFAFSLSLFFSVITFLDLKNRVKQLIPLINCNFIFLTQRCSSLTNSLLMHILGSVINIDTGFAFIKGPQPNSNALTACDAINAKLIKW